MKAVAFSEQGSTEVLQYIDVPKPTLDTNEVLVKVEACAVNYLDLHARRNRPEIAAKLRRGDTPHILGSDIAGTIAEIGAAVRGVSVGDRIVLAPCIPCGVCSDCHRGAENLCDTQELIGFQTNGGYAEYVKAPVQNAIRMPDELLFVSAAAMPIAYLTAWHMLMTRAQLRPEDDILILGIGGGVGSAGLQIAKLTGARVFATASSDEKLERARQMGADVTINYKDTDFSEVVLNVTEGRGVDVVLEHVGAATWEQSIASLAKNGRLVSCGVTTGNIGTINIRKMYQKELTVMGAALGTVAELRTLIHLAGQGKLQPIIDRVLPLHEARQAHLLLENRQNFGKVCLCP
ncbi:MAG: zinc-binding dehydrogenase [Candidatus Poribacteria bacterium]|nr:zinc-binding dehydrogenase [Candidatus Poribacteria bacterium]